MYCEEKGIASNTYFYWQRKLQEAACQQMVQGKQDVAESEIIGKSLTSQTENDSPMPLGWAVCREAEVNRGGSGLSIEIGCSRISVSNDADLELLKKVCRMLMALC